MKVAYFCCKVVALKVEMFYVWQTLSHFFWYQALDMNLQHLKSKSGFTPLNIRLEETQRNSKKKKLEAK